MTFLPDNLQEHLTENYGFTLVLKPSSQPQNKKVHRLAHSNLKHFLHIQLDGFTQANLAMPYTPEYVDKISDCLTIDGIVEARESNRSCFSGYPDKDPKHPTKQKQALCFTIEHQDAVEPFMELMFGLHVSSRK